LTPRELEVLTLVADGLSNPEIAERLVIDKRTVESHVGRILGKTGSTSRTQAVRWAIRHGLTSEGT
jgi:DNA-binding NarL/FixJ family response regulator